MKNIFAVIIAACFLIACNSGKKFTSRKYTSGRYVSHAAHFDRKNKNTSEPGRSVAIKRTINEKEVILDKKVENEKVILATADALASIKKNDEEKTGTFLNKRTEQLEKNKIFHIFNKKSFKALPGKAGSKVEQKEGTKSLTSVILSGAGVIIEIVGFILAIVSAEYIFLALLGVGLALGIVGLVMGIQGIKEYKREKYNGNKNTTTLVLGIVGTAVGGVAIFLAIYLSLFGALIVSAGGI